MITGFLDTRDLSLLILGDFTGTTRGLALGTVFGLVIDHNDAFVNVSNTDQAANAADASEDLFDTAGTESPPSSWFMYRRLEYWLLNHWFWWRWW